MEESDRQFAHFSQQMEMGAEQMTTQMHYIELLEKKISDYKTQTAQSFRRYEDDVLARMITAVRQKRSEDG